MRNRLFSLARISYLGAFSLAIGLSLETAQAQAVDSSLSFFITSVNAGKGANLGGLTGADAHCQKLAEAVGSTKKMWRAYLSTQPSGGTAAVNAKDRIGAGPWFNAKKVRVASSVANLHSASNQLGKQNSLNEKGEVVNGRGDNPNRHDILTGSTLDGTAFPAGTDKTCANWTSETTGSPQVGHHDKDGGGENPQSWNSAHAPNGCSIAALRNTGGEAYFYCFAADVPGSSGVLDGRKERMDQESHVLFNPANQGAGPVFRFELQDAQEIEVQVFSLKGGIIATLAKGFKAAGSHEVAWNGKDGSGVLMPKGVYLIRLNTKAQP